MCKMETQNVSNNTCLNPNSVGNNDKLRPSVKKSESMIMMNQFSSLKRSESIHSNDCVSPCKKSINPDKIEKFGDKTKKSISNEKFERVERNKSISPEKTEKIGERNVVLTEVRVLEIGNSFGELALIENKPRAATIKCKENCHFAVLDKQFFGHILSRWGDMRGF